MTITNVIIKTSDRKWDWGVNDVMPGSDGLRFLVIWKKTLVEIRLWAGPLQLGVDCGRCRNSQHSKNCVSLSSCRKTKSQEVNKRFVPEQRRIVSVSYFPAFVYLYSCITTIQHKFWMKLFAFHKVQIPSVNVWIQLFSHQLWVNSSAY